MISVSLPMAATFRIADREWLWREWIPSGALSILAGEPGTGKSTVAASIAAAVSTGGLLPSGEQTKQGRVVIYNSEDQIAQTINPRLLAAGADLTMIHYAHETRTVLGARPFDPANDLPLLKRTVEQVQKGDKPVRLIIIDPLMSAMRGITAKTMRASLEALSKLAEDTGCAVLGIAHFNKGGSKKPLAERVSGSHATVAVARSVLATVSARETGKEPVLVRVKSNVSSCVGFYSYSVEPTWIPFEDRQLATTEITWGEFQMGEHTTSEDIGEGSSLDDASDFLREIVGEEGKLMREIEAETQFLPFSFRTVRRAQSLLGIRAKKIGREWFWFPPEPHST